MINIDIISGFLGAGKTTFANMLLRHYMDNGLRPVYIVNEFGETGLDAEIIKASGFEAIEMEGGCICCTLKDDVGAAILQVIEAFSPTNIVFEPSGIFIFDHFFDILKDEQISKKCKLGNVFTVVDSVNFNFAKVIYGSFIYNQIKNAKVILLSKLERAKQSVEEIICDVKNINSDAFIMSKIWSEWTNKDFETLIEQQNRPHVEYNSHHHANFQSITIRPEKPFTQEEFEQFLNDCKSGMFGAIYRMKGILIVDGSPTLVNIAMQDISIEKFKGIAEQSFTFIGQKINTSILKTL